MEPLSSRTWIQHQAALPSCNQRNGHFLSDPDTAFSVKKLVDLNESAASLSPELENSTDNLQDSGHERAESEHETQVGNEDEIREALAQRCRQLQEDVEVLVVHMEKQEKTHARERKKAEDEHRALLLKNSALERELSGLRVERDALFKQNARMVAQRTDDERQANDEGEAHDEVLRALAQQQQQKEALQVAVTSATQARAETRNALDKAQMHCRRLEEELSSAHAQVLHLQNERDSLKAALDATITGAAGFEARQLQAQDEVIASLRADLVQMDFELKTLSVDKDTLEEQVEKLQLRLATSERDGDYEVVSLTNNSDKIAKQKGQKKRTTIRPVRSNRETTGRRGSDLFNNLMELPNTVTEPQECANATIWLSPAASYFSSSNSQDHRRRSFRERIAPPTGLTSFVSKTVQSARKHLASPLHNTFGGNQEK
ncbi:hypothetical protein PPTG_12055 [Phytophthora nicotianae INRA-310]|uniref:Uncharacterized protein n=3 Tax=Phytophthora nicotianae TaxID=4792 RepID=W2Q4Z5_PHYN3|nr:hypothetical protein PPTG_12055 [Phytophthora nicotianae INRA-310]ETN08212.1 hypothetical protein PPTG_12055 [Phytophthora nicotianae INRA-310]ETO74642.1 hypothetical protein F444_09650 [Phytophthora nicotianae P1976]KUF81515.1 hypothetical protein AM587_10017266 [Phytophthora nicotianae]KUF93886.1 hypothetical protein AM588_10006489 [Phytophthora nicotianae]